MLLLHQQLVGINAELQGLKVANSNIVEDEDELEALARQSMFYGTEVTA